VRTLSSELVPHAARLVDRPRVYADANVPAGVVAFMRQRLRWDVLFVLEHADLRRARDGEHYRLARQLGRTLVTQDRDYFDDRRFPPAESGGVVVLSGPDERVLTTVLLRIDRIVFKARRRRTAAAPTPTPPLLGRKLHAHADWPPRKPTKRR
jgi:hypothetical protein